MCTGPLLSRGGNLTVGSGTGYFLELQGLYGKRFRKGKAFGKNTASPPGEDDFSPKPGGPGLAVRKEAFANFAR